MLKPQGFQQENVAIMNLPYIAMEDSLRESLDAGGVLGSGQIVWTETAFVTRPRPHSAMAYIDGIGVVRIDPRWLTPPRS